MERLDRVIGVVDRVMEMVCHLLLIGIVAVTVLQVVLRFVLDSPTSWSEEVALLLLVWFGMIAIAIGVRRHGHIAITTLRDLLPPRLARGMDLLAELLLLGFSLMLLWESLALIRLAGVQVMPATGLSRAWLYYPVFVGGLLMSVNGIVNILTGRLSPPRGEQPAHE
ncbi:TRAP transporter small permease [Chelatococcus sp. GCM10030263]|uniref:TRAP transporter small permease n=1 Tax=Chelatococcus sp. GCM10030263 TaxID=3273387 RepID=UPI003623941A